jgi:hypothetical protein
MSNYTIADFENFIFDGIAYNLPSTILDIIKNLERELAFNVDTSSVTTNNNTKKYDKSHGNSTNVNAKSTHSSYNNNGKRHAPNKVQYNNKSVKDEDWEIIRNFKSTKIEAKEGIEKMVNDIRLLLNKISNKNYDTQIPVIIEAVKQFIETLQNNEKTENTEKHKDDDFAKLNKIIFDIIYTNKFFGELYAKLYYELIVTDSKFMDVLKDQIGKIKTVQDLTYIDPNKDYDGYCNYTKSNDGKKSFIAFLIQINKYEPTIFDYIIELLDYYVNMSIEYVDMENRMNEIEEMTERVFLIITNSEQVLIDHSHWKTDILHKIIVLSQMKMKEHKSLSNRIIFRYMDIIDSMNS